MVNENSYNSPTHARNWFGNPLAVLSALLCKHHRTSKSTMEASPLDAGRQLLSFVPQSSPYTHNSLHNTLLYFSTNHFENHHIRLCIKITYRIKTSNNAPFLYMEKKIRTHLTKAAAAAVEVSTKSAWIDNVPERGPLHLRPR